MRLVVVSATTTMLLLIATMSSAQDVTDALLKLGTRYQNMESFALDMVIEAQLSENSPLQVYKKAKMRKKRNTFYYAIDQSETVVTDKFLLLINKEEKRMTMRELDLSEQASLIQKYNQVGLDSITSKYDSAVYLGIGRYGKGYSIYSAKNMIAKTDLFIDEKTGYISRIVYDYNKKIAKDIVKVVISFTYPLLTESEEKLVKEDTYITKTGTRYTPAQKYLNYGLNKVDNE